MTRMNKWIIAGIVVLTLGVVLAVQIRTKNSTTSPIASSTETAAEVTVPKKVETKNRTDLAQYNAVYQLAAELETGWQVSYVAPTEAIALFPTGANTNSLDAAQIFIRQFEANDFLTLSTVNVISREQTTVGAHAAVRYEIEKKSDVAQFANQPAWRSNKHQLIDIRFSTKSPTTFFVVAYDPALGAEKFNAFIAGLKFYNDKNSVLSPVEGITDRITKKSFGTLVSPASSPVQPEKFSGYHTGWDYEVLSDELNKEVPVTAFCGGKLRVKQTTSGYGGVAVQDCEIDGVVMTVLYGHLNLASVANNVGDFIAPGQKIGLLGDDKSAQTDGERKHLHFSLHKGSSSNLRGYVDSQAELSAWLDPKNYLP